jgi:hypothetical protein
MRLSTNVKFTKVKDHTAAATTDQISAIVDMSGYDGVVFLTSLGTAAAANVIKVMQDDANATTGMADLAGTSVSSGSSDEDLWVDVFRPTKRYLQLKVVRDGSTTIESIWAIQYAPRNKAVDNTTTGTITGELHQSPAEGTA